MDSRSPDGLKVSPTRSVTLSTCPFCSAGCGILLQTHGLELVGVSPSRNHPTSQGRLCARGWHCHEGPLWGERLLFPTVREGERHRRVSWEEGLDEAARQIRTTLGSGSPMGLLASGRVTNEEAFLGVRLAREGLGTPHLDSSFRWVLPTMLAACAPHGEPLDLQGILEYVGSSDVVLLLEEDLARSHPQVAFYLLRALAGGARLVTLGPCPTQMSDLAKPPLFLDPAGDPWELPSLEDALGAAEDVRRMAVIFAPFSWDDARLYSVVRHLTETTGRWARDGGPEIRMLPLPILSNDGGAFWMGLAPNLLPGARSVSEDGARQRLRSEWGAGVQMDGGSGAGKMLREVAGLVVLRENPPEVQWSPVESRTALGELKSLVVLDAYRSLTSEMATVTLPVGAFSETRGSLVSLDGLVQHFRPARPPPGEAREGWAVLVDLLRALGVQADYRSLPDVRGEISRIVPELRQEMLDEADGPWRWRISPLRASTEPASTPLSLIQAQGREGEWPDLAGPGAPFRLALVGSHAWDDDLVVRFSPTLRRDGASRRKLFPSGVVSMNRQDGERMGIRDGWKVRIRSRTGALDVPAFLDSGVEPGIILAACSFRDQFSEVLGGRVGGHVIVERL